MGKNSARKKTYEELTNRFFVDDEDARKKYYILEVKYNEEFNAVCCHCVKVTKTIEKQIEEGKPVQFPKAYADENIFDVEYCSTQVLNYEKSLAVPNAEDGETKDVVDETTGDKSTASLHNSSKSGKRKRSG